MATRTGGGRVVLFGATGYTGRLTAEALVRRFARPLLAGRSAERLAGLAAELGGDVETAVADVGRPETVRALLAPGDVLVSTVGPFTRWGRPAVDAALGAGAPYLDSTGEAPFLRRLFEEDGPRAAAAGTGLVPAFGFDYVPGNLAAAEALAEAGPDAARVDVGYFATGDAGFSGGTQASSAATALEPAYTWRDGRLVTVRGAERLRAFEIDGASRVAVSIGGTEQLALPRLHPGLRDVEVHLGWFGSFSRAVQLASLVSAPLLRVPGARRALRGAAARATKGSTGGPDAEARARAGSRAVAIASAADGDALATVHLSGPDAYTLTGRLLAWGATTALDGGLRGTGALGPVDAFGLDRLRAGCAEAGLVRA